MRKIRGETSGLSKADSRGLWSVLTVTVWALLSMCVCFSKARLTATSSCSVTV